MPHLVNVKPEESRTFILGTGLLGDLEDLELVRIQWDSQNSQWICYEAGETIPTDETA